MHIRSHTIPVATAVAKWLPQGSLIVSVSTYVTVNINPATMDILHN